MFLLKQYRQIVSFFPECQIVGTAKDTFQFPSAGNKSKNIDYIDEAADSGADPALPGEMVLSAVGRV